MHVDYIRTLSEAFILDNPEYAKDITAEDLTEHFYGVIKEVRENQSDLYNIIESKNKFEQQKIVTEYFHLLLNSNQDSEFEPISEDQEVILTEFLGLSVGISGVTFAPALLMLLYYYFRKPISKTVMNIVFLIVKTAKYIGDKLTKYGNPVRLAYAIINQNTEKCYQKAGFNPKDATFKHYFSHLPMDSFLNDFSNIFMSRAEDIQMDKLRECFMYSLKESIKLITSSYFTCLRNTGDLSKLPLERDYSMFTKVLTKSSLSADCSVFIKDLNIALGQFEKILDLIYYNDVTKIAEEKQDLMNSIYNIQKSTSNNSGNNNYNIRTYPQDSNSHYQKTNNNNRRN